MRTDFSRNDRYEPISASGSFGRNLRSIATVALLGAVGLGGGVVACGVIMGQEFEDTPLSDNQFGRTVNSLSALIAGVLAQQIYGHSEFDLLIEKPWYADARIKGRTSVDSIESKVKLATTSAVFKAKGAAGSQQGKVEKSEFDWGITQKDTTTWEVSRFGWKLDTTLKIVAKDGKIEGEYVRKLGQDWKITGTYDKEGNVNIEVIPAWDEPNFKITGRIKAL